MNTEYPIDGPARVLDREFRQGISAYLQNFDVVSRWEQGESRNRMYLRMRGKGGKGGLTATLVHLNSIMPRMITHAGGWAPGVDDWELILWVGLGGRELDYPTFLREEAKRTRARNRQMIPIKKPIIIES